MVSSFVLVYSSKLILISSFVFMHFLDFYNWNKVKIRYCDGASFAGHPEAESQLKVCFGLAIISLKLQPMNEKVLMH